LYVRRGVGSRDGVEFVTQQVELLVPWFRGSVSPVLGGGEEGQEETEETGGIGGQEERRNERVRKREKENKKTRGRKRE
jgi:hypothetical protein